MRRDDAPSWKAVETPHRLIADNSDLDIIAEVFREYLEFNTQPCGEIPDPEGELFVDPFVYEMAAKDQYPRENVIWLRSIGQLLGPISDFVYQTGIYEERYAEIVKQEQNNQVTGFGQTIEKLRKEKIVLSRRINIGKAALVMGLELLDKDKDRLDSPLAVEITEEAINFLAKQTR